MKPLSQGGGIYLLGVQALAVVCILFWGISSTFLLLWLVNKLTSIRMKPSDEILGADFTEHNVCSLLKAEQKNLQDFHLHPKEQANGFDKSDRLKHTVHENKAFQNDGF
jgi:Ammonium Transporter Family